MEQNRNVVDNFLSQIFQKMNYSSGENHNIEELIAASRKVMESGLFQIDESMIEANKDEIQLEIDKLTYKPEINDKHVMKDIDIIVDRNLEEKVKDIDENTLKLIETMLPSDNGIYKQLMDHKIDPELAKIVLFYRQLITKCKKLLAFEISAIDPASLDIIDKL